MVIQSFTLFLTILKLCQHLGVLLVALLSPDVSVIEIVSVTSPNPYLMSASHSSVISFILSSTKFFWAEMM